MENIIKWFSNEKEKGFIEYKGNNIFIHYSTIQGKSVELELVKTETGYKAISIKGDK